MGEGSGILRGRACLTTGFPRFGTNLRPIVSTRLSINSSTSQFPSLRGGSTELMTDATTKRHFDLKEIGHFAFHVLI